MKKIWETGIILFAVMGFWGMIYPDLCFTQDVCRTVYEDTYGEAEENIAESGQEEKDMFTKICEADAGQIRVKSKLFDYFSDVAGKTGNVPEAEAEPQTVKKRVSITESKGNDNDVNKGNRGAK